VVRGGKRHELPEFASEPPELVEPPELSVVEDCAEEPVVELAVGVDVVDVVASVPVDPEPAEVFEVCEADVEGCADEVREVEADEVEVVCVALGTAAATANEPATPLTATTAVTVAVRTLPCRTERAAPSASMAVLHREGSLSIRYPRWQRRMRRS
jgi:hypothetical protein